jgi:hypothetical protein
MHARKAERILKVPAEIPLWQIGLFVQSEYVRPILRLHIDRRPAPVPENHRVGCRARYASNGRHAALPKIQGVECTESATIDPKPIEPRTDAGLGLFLTTMGLK